MEENKKKVAKQETPKMVEIEKVQAMVEQYNTNMQKAAQEIQRMSQLLSDRTLDYFFKVLEHKDMFDPAFVKYAVSIITQAFTPKEPETTSEENKEEESK